MLAISARQMERQKKLNGDQDSLQLYQESIRSLTPHLLAKDPKYGMPKEFVEFRPRMNIMAVLIMQFSPLGRWEIAQPPGGTQRSY
jgi:hypothetical protein